MLVYDEGAWRRAGSAWRARDRTVAATGIGMLLPEADQRRGGGMRNVGRLRWDKVWASLPPVVCRSRRRMR